VNVLLGGIIDPNTISMSWLFGPGAHQAFIARLGYPTDLTGSTTGPFRARLNEQWFSTQGSVFGGNYVSLLRIESVT
jgi:hypothetical protein